MVTGPNGEQRHADLVASIPDPFSVGDREAFSGVPTAQGRESGASLLSYEASPRNAKTSDRIPRQTQSAAAI
jgi:hypothetical protein